MHAKVKVHFVLYLYCFHKQQVALMAWRMEKYTTVGLAGVVTTSGGCRKTRFESLTMLERC